MKHPYLKDKVVHVTPVDAGIKWKGILANYSEKKNQPFLFKKTVKSYQVPLRSASEGGGVVSILDNTKPNKCPDVLDESGKKPKELTQRQYFEYQLGVNMNPHAKKEDNFWRIDENHRSTVQIREGQLRLNLSEPLHMLKYLILKANSSEIAESPEAVKNLKTASYNYVFVEEGYESDREADNYKKELEVMKLFGQITSSDEEMRNFLRLAGQMPNEGANTSKLMAAVGKIKDQNLDQFIKIASDPNKEIKIFVSKAVQSGALHKNGSVYKTIEGTTLGDLYATIKFLEDEEHSSTYEYIKGLIDKKLEA